MRVEAHGHVRCAQNCESESDSTAPRAPPRLATTCRDETCVTGLTTTTAAKETVTQLKASWRASAASRDVTTLLSFGKKRTSPGTGLGVGSDLHQSPREGAGWKAGAAALKVEDIHEPRGRVRLIVQTEAGRSPNLSGCSVRHVPSPF